MKQEVGYYQEREQKKLANIAWIECLKAPMEMESSRISVKVMNKKIDFWPSSDTWFLHHQNKYGMGIARLCKKIIETVKSSDSQQ